LRLPPPEERFLQKHYLIACYLCGRLFNVSDSSFYHVYYPILKPQEVNKMAQKEILDKLSIYIPQKKQEEKPVERLIKLGDKRDRSVNYLVVEAILEYLKREEGKK